MCHISRAAFRTATIFTKFEDGKKSQPPSPPLDDIRVMVIV